MKQMLSMKFSLVFCLALLISSVARSEVSKGNLALGFNYPGIGLKYFLNDRIPVELKTQIDTDVTVAGLRCYYYFRPGAEKLHLFTGFEIDSVTFKGEDSKGSGMAALVFVGSELFLSKPFSIQLDMGPAMIALSDTDTSTSVSGMEFVANIGLNYYFGK